MFLCAYDGKTDAHRIKRLAELVQHLDAASVVGIEAIHDHKGILTVIVRGPNSNYFAIKEDVENVWREYFGEDSDDSVVVIS